MRTHYRYIIGLAIAAAIVAGGLWANIGNRSLSETHITTEKIHMLPGVNKASGPITTGTNSR